jgi:tetratricopeptide (TPR) repeat protein
MGYNVQRSTLDVQRSTTTLDVGRWTLNVERCTRFIAIALLLIPLTGCGPTKSQKASQLAVQDYLHGNYSAAVDRLRPVAKEPNEDFVLNNVRLGSAAMANYDFAQAEAAFLQAMEVINSTGVNQGGRTLGAVLVDEKVKIWKGEPFERAMAAFYLGLQYYIRHDYENARASFENALFKLRDYADEKDAKDQYREQESNFALGLIMLAKSWQRLGRDDLARANFQRAVELRPDLGDIADYDRNYRSNVLLVIDFGYGPRKVTGSDGSMVGFAPTPLQAGDIPHPRITLDDQLVNIHGLAVPTVDLLAMAQDRKWQSIDTIRAIKSAVGTGMLIGGGVMGAKGLNESGARQRTDLMVAGGLLATGLLLKATSQADIRQWETLPRSVFLMPLFLPPGKHTLSVDFPAVHALRQTWIDIDVPAEGEATYYLRMQPYHSGPFTWPPPTATGLDQPPAAPPMAPPREPSSLPATAQP